MIRMSVNRPTDIPVIGCKGDDPSDVGTGEH